VGLYTILVGYDWEPVRGYWFNSDGITGLFLWLLPPVKWSGVFFNKNFYLSYAAYYSYKPLKGCIWAESSYKCSYRVHRHDEKKVLYQSLATSLDLRGACHPLNIHEHSKSVQKKKRCNTFLWHSLLARECEYTVDS